MGVIKPKHYIMVLVFAIALSIRLYFAFQTSHFSSDEAYYTLRQIEHIKQTGLPLINDSLSYSGRAFFVLPGFYYLLSFFNLFLPLVVVTKVLPNIMACMLIFIVYLIAKKITNHENSSIITACLSGFLPLYFSETINNISVYSFVIPLAFLLIYFFMNIEEKHYLIYIIITFFALLLTHAILMLVIIGMIAYLILVKIEKLEQNRLELESVLFSFFVLIWFFIIIYKKVFLLHGAAFMWQNIPSMLFSSYFSKISLFTIFNQIGIVTFLAGIYIIYKYLFREKNRGLYLLISLCIVLLILISLRLITLNLGIIMLSTTLLLLFSQFIKIYYLFIEKSKFQKYAPYLISLLIAIVLISLIPPSLAYAERTSTNAFTDEEINALKWLKDNSEDKAAIISLPEQGASINYVAERRNAIDSNFLLIPSINERYDDIMKIYTTKSVLEAIHLLNKYDADYIYFSNKRLKEYGISEIGYSDDKCIVPVYEKEGVIIYNLRCEIRSNEMISK
jgi:hypothetical protein